MSGNALVIGSQTVATWSGSESFTVALELNGRTVSVGEKLSEAGKLKLTVTGKGGKSTSKEITLTATPPPFDSMVIDDIEPVDILPIIGQVETGDKQVYSHIAHLRVAEATRIRDMMWKYGAGGHSPEQYQQLMKRLNVGMTLEKPK